MKKFITEAILITLCIALITAALFAQELPDYNERFFSTNADSLQGKLSSLSETGATEGVIDPDEYIVGPGDKLLITISGVKEAAERLAIDQEGFLYIPHAGPVNLKNLKLSEAKELISGKINEYYKNVEIFISLIDFRKIRLSLTGEIDKPKILTLPANSRLLDLLASAGGIKPTSDIRNIKIISRDSSEKYFDLLSFLRLGDYRQNPLLREGDVVIIDKVDKLVRISGQVKYPAAYEYVADENVKELIILAGGFLTKARTDTIEVVSFTIDGRLMQSSYYSLEEINNGKILLKNGDHVIIREKPEYFEDHYVSLKGYVKYPGWYKIVKHKTTLKEIIEEAGGFLTEASLTEASISRNLKSEEKDPEYERLRMMNPADMTEDEYDYFKAKSRQTSGRVIVDFVDLFVNNNIIEDIILVRGDVINVPEKKNYIIMLGQLLNPGKIIYNPELKVTDYINLAGGFGWRAIEDEVRVIKARTGEWIDAEDADELEPGDTIWVPEEPPDPKFWEIFMDALTVVAQLAAIVAAMTAVIIATR